MYTEKPGADVPLDRTMIDDDPSLRSSSDTRQALTEAQVKPGRGSHDWLFPGEISPITKRVYNMALNEFLAWLATSLIKFPFF